MAGPEGGPQRAQPVSEQLDEPTVTQLVLQLETARQRGAQARMVAQVALAIAGFSIGAAVWAGSRAGAAIARADRVELEMEMSREATAKLAQPVAIPRSYRPQPADVPTEPPNTAEGDVAPWVADAMLLEIEALEAALARVESRLSEVETGLVDWGNETKRYVDERLRRSRTATPSPQPRQTELNEIWMRLDMLEQRLGAR
jgi:hypothetical protein